MCTHTFLFIYKNSLQNFTQRLVGEIANKMNLPESILLFSELHFFTFDNLIRQSIH